MIDAAKGARAGGAPAASDQYVQSLARGLAVIRAFDTDHPKMTLTEVAARTDLTRATARRFLYTLVELGYVRTDGKIFALTAKVLQLGYAYLSGLSLPQLAQPHLEELSLQLGESTSAAVLEGTDIAYIARVATRRIMTVGITVGTRFPAYATSMGRVLLAALPPDQLQDYLARTDIRPLTPLAIGTREGLLAELATVQGAGLVPAEPGTRARADVDCRAGPRRPQGGRRHQRVIAGPVGREPAGPGGLPGLRAGGNGGHRRSHLRGPVLRALGVGRLRAPGELSWEGPLPVRWRP